MQLCRTERARRKWAQGRGCQQRQMNVLLPPPATSHGMQVEIFAVRKLLIPAQASQPNLCTALVQRAHVASLQVNIQGQDSCRVLCTFRWFRSLQGCSPYFLSSG